MKKPERILFLGLFLFFIIALAIIAISSSNKKRGILESWLQETSSDVVVFENMLDYTTLKQYIDPHSTTDPLLVSTVGTIVFDPAMSNDDKVQALKVANFTDPFVSSTINSSSNTSQTIVSTVQNYLLSLKIGGMVPSSSHS